MATSAIVIQQKAGRVAGLLEQRYGLHGQSLQDRLSRGRRQLPVDMRRAVERLAEAEAMAQHPKLLLRLDDSAIDRDYRLVVKRLERLPRRAGSPSLLASIGSSVMGAVLSLTLIAVGVVGWAVVH